VTPESPGHAFPFRVALQIRTPHSVPARSIRQGARQRSRITAARPGIGDAGSPIGHLEVGDSEARDSRNEPSATQRALLRHGSLVPMHEKNLLIQRHLFDEKIGSPIGRQTLVQPLAFRRLLLCTVWTLRKESREQARKQDECNPKMLD